MYLKIYCNSKKVIIYYLYSKIKTSITKISNLNYHNYLTINILLVYLLMKSLLFYYNILNITKLILLIFYSLILYFLLL